MNSCTINFIFIINFQLHSISISWQINFDTKFHKYNDKKKIKVILLNCILFSDEMLETKQEKKSVIIKDIKYWVDMFKNEKIITNFASLCKWFISNVVKYWPLLSWTSLKILDWQTLWLISELYRLNLSQFSFRQYRMKFTYLKRTKTTNLNVKNLHEFTFRVYFFVFFLFK